MGQRIRVIGTRATTRGSMARGRLSRRPLRRGHWASRSLAPYLVCGGTQSPRRPRTPRQALAFSTRAKAYPRREWAGRVRTASGTCLIVRWAHGSKSSERVPPPRGSTARGRLSRRPLRRGHWASRSLAPLPCVRRHPQPSSSTHTASGSGI